MSTATAPQQSQQQQTHFIQQSIETPTPEPSRRYVQWKEDDVGLLLTDLEQPGHYNKWKENKSGFSKRVAEHVFKNAMYYEAVKFKVRWLESRFKLWNRQLTEDESAVDIVREKLMKEFPYYDRCKSIFSHTTNSSTTIAVPQQQPQLQISHFTPGAASVITTVVEERVEDVQDYKSILKPEISQMTNESSSLTTTLIQQQQHEQEHQLQLQQQRSPFTDNSNNKRHLDISNVAPVLSFATSNKKRVTTTTHNRSSSSKPAVILPNNILEPSIDHSSSSSMVRINDGMMTEERKIKMMEIELELKKMDHQERMQEMKLEQLRLEIELEKLKRRDIPSQYHQQH